MSLDATERFAPGALALIRQRTRELAARVQSSTLANGARLHILADGNHGIACLEIWIRVGSGDEPKPKAGISHLLEHLMFRGTTEMPDGEFDAHIEALGIQANAWTWYDTTAYTSTLPSEMLGELMELETDRLSNLDITDEIFTTEREVVLNERSLTADSDPNALAQEHLDRMLFGEGPYAHPVIGYRESIEGLSREDILDWYRNYYAPDAIDIIVTGDVNVSEVRELAARTFGTLTRPERPSPERPSASGSKDTGTEERIVLPVAAPSVLMAWPHPQRSNTEEVARWKVLAELLVWSRGGILRDALEYNTETILEQQFYVNEHRLGHSVLWEASPREGITTDELVEAFFRTLSRFAESAPSQEDLDAAQLRLLTQIASKSTPWQLARMIGTALHDAGGLDTLEADLDALSRVDGPAVQALAKQLCDRQRAVILHVLPQ